MNTMQNKNQPRPGSGGSCDPVFVRVPSTPFGVTTHAPDLAALRKERQREGLRLMVEESVRLGLYGDD